MPLCFFMEVWKKNTYIHLQITCHYGLNIVLIFKKVPYAWHGGKFFSFKNWKNVLGKK